MHVLMEAYKCCFRTWSHLNINAGRNKGTHKPKESCPGVPCSQAQRAREEAWPLCPCSFIPLFRAGCWTIHSGDGRGLGTLQNAHFISQWSDAELLFNSYHWRFCHCPTLWKKPNVQWPCAPSCGPLTTRQAGGGGGPPAAASASQRATSQRPPGGPAKP